MAGSVGMYAFPLAARIAVPIWVIGSGGLWVLGVISGKAAVVNSVVAVFVYTYTHSLVGAA